jgi:hypothetical protein
MRPKRHICVDLGGGAWARVSPDIQPETVAALRRMMELAAKQFGGQITVHHVTGIEEIEPVCRGVKSGRR